MCKEDVVVNQDHLKQYKLVFSFRLRTHNKHVDSVFNRRYETQYPVHIHRFDRSTNSNSPSTYGDLPISTVAD
jgi:hypothetical protein